MAGIRIQHATVRDKTLTLVDQKRPYTAPYDCPMCHRTHLFKTYHLQLDSVGACIVSPEIVGRLQRLPSSGGFSVGEEIANPPAQRIVLGGPLRHREVLAHPTLIEPR
jgi:hypothetical protein